jgi:aspartate racemase
MHIGLIGGIGLAATEYYYRSLVERHAAGGTRLELTIAHGDVRELARNLERREPHQQAESFARLVQRLQAAGAQIAAVTSMGGHFCIRELEALSPLPLLDAIPLVDTAMRRQNLTTVGIIGTRMVMETRLYGGITAAPVVAPAGAMLEEVHRAYIEMAVAGRVSTAQREVFFAAGRELCRSQGAQAVMLGGTDLFLAFDGQDCGFPLIDCAGIHVDALFQQSLMD